MFAFPVFFLCHKGIAIYHSRKGTCWKSSTNALLSAATKENHFRKPPFETAPFASCGGTQPRCLELRQPPCGPETGSSRSKSSHREDEQQRVEGYWTPDNSLTRGAATTYLLAKRVQLPGVEFCYLQLRCCEGDRDKHRASRHPGFSRQLPGC